MPKITTLLIVNQGNRILLGMKKRGFGAGRWNGFGGKVQPDESVEDAARRETEEECGLKVGAIEKVGIIDFDFSPEPNPIEVHVYRAAEFSGEPAESEEMAPRWFAFADIPYGEMWPDDRYWLPLLLEGKKFRGRFLFGPKDAILEQEIIIS